MKSVAVIIVTFNSELDITGCLQSVFKQTYEGATEVIVVDNDSQDTTPRLLADFPGLKILQNKNNGYAGGNNVGITYALQQGFDHIVLLNPDMEVAPDWLAELVKVADEHEQAGLVQSKVLFFNEQFRVNTIGNPLHFLGFSWSGGFKDLSSQHTTITQIPSASGSSVLVKRAVWERIGLLDEKLFMYHEDVDISWRARLAGYDIYLAPASKAFHKYSFSFGTKKFYYAERNRLLVWCSNFRWLTLLLLLPMLLLTELAMLIYAGFTGWFKYKLKAYGGFVLLLPHLLVRKYRYAGARVRSDRDLLGVMTARLTFEALTSPFLDYVYNPLAVFYFSIIKFIIRW